MFPLFPMIFLDVSSFWDIPRDVPISPAVPPGGGRVTSSGPGRRSAGGDRGAQAAELRGVAHHDALTKTLCRMGS
jgi:hypothetical protein